MNKTSHRPSISPFILLLPVLLSFGHAMAQQPAVSRADAGSDVIMRAMQDELTRSVEKLRLKDLEKPYFIEYGVIDVESITISAAFGGILFNRHDRSRGMAVEVRVGSYDSDNEPGGYPGQLVIEDDYDALRHDLWLATDASYRQGIETLTRKRAFMKNRVALEQENIPDFSKEESVVDIQPRRVLRADEKQWAQWIREWSAIFREFPEISQSNVSLQAQLFHRYLVNSEGTRVRQSSLLISLDTRAYTQSPDGMWLNHFQPYYVSDFDQLPKPDEVALAIRKMAKELVALRQAPVLKDNYLGPVLLTGQASGVMFSQLLASELCSQRASAGSQQEDASSLFNRINRRVLPAFLTVYDDPSQQKLDNTALLGHFATDDQGVKARRVSLIEEGILKNLLMSRRPRKHAPNSNGHGRSGFVGGASASVGNLFIQARDGKSYEELKQELIRTCKLQTLDYGIILKTMEESGGRGLPDPVLAYRVYVADGREELIRGLTLGELNLKDLRQLQAVGNDRYVHNQIEGGGRNGGGYGTALVVPSVLVEELEIKKPTGTQQKPLLLTHPYFGQ
ncbi:MAG: metallopeptidase TldD-related protein [Blastocatellia bacterium]